MDTVLSKTFFITSFPSNSNGSIYTYIWIYYYGKWEYCWRM